MPDHMPLAMYHPAMPVIMNWVTSQLLYATADILVWFYFVNNVKDVL